MNDQAANSKTRLLLLNRDLMAGIAVTNAAKTLDLRVDRATSASELVERWSSAKEQVAVVVLDLNMPVEWDDLAEMLTGAEGDPPVIGFGPHVDVEGRRAAKQAGLKRIYSNGDFHRQMGEIIARYAGIDPQH
ncbi:MAG: hypothetical protein KF883_15810 [Thermomicrobiales bacterium]|nr:hypothetical protein [Thermomicrobiales bacterium]